jgi:AcrR family transcriptional regulator
MSLAPRKSPRQRRSTATVDTILEAAARILEANGLDALTTNAVAERAGVSIGSLYQYFPGKAAILAELIRRQRADLLAGIDEAASRKPDGSLEESIRALVDAAVAHQLHRARLARALEYAEGILPLTEETSALSRAIVERVRVLLMGHGVTDNGVAARDVVALGKGMIDAAGIAGETDENALARRVCQAILGYLGIAR